MQGDGHPRSDVSLKTLGLAGLILIPAGTGMFALNLEVGGVVMLTAGWILALAPIVLIPILQSRGYGDPLPRRPKVAPTFIFAAALTAAAVAKEAPEAALVLGYIAVVWFYARWLV